MKTKSMLVLSGALIQFLVYGALVAAEPRPSYECSVVSSGSEKSIIFDSNTDSATLRTENVIATISRPSPDGLQITITQEEVTKLGAHANAEGRPTRLEAVLVHPFGEAGFGGKATCVLTH